MNSLLEKAINREPIEDKDIEEALKGICEDVHSSCFSECPVHKRYGNVPPPRKGRMERCPFFKDGKLMLAYLRYQGSLSGFLMLTNKD